MAVDGGGRRAPGQQGRSVTEAWARGWMGVGGGHRAGAGNRGFEPEGEGGGRADGLPGL